MWSTYESSLTSRKVGNWITQKEYTPIEPYHEEALIHAAQTNPKAFDVLYQMYVTRIYLYIHTSVRNEEDASDLTQQVFLQALIALPKYKPQGVSFAAWLFRIARNLALNASTRRREALSWSMLPEALHPTVEYGPEITILQQETHSRLNTLLRQLDPSKRDLLALRFAGGLTSGEIAGVVGKSPAAVKKQLTRTIQTLKEQFDER